MSASPQQTERQTAGVQFPVDSAGTRSTGSLAKEVIAAAVEPVDAGLAERTLRTKEWRKNYIEPFTEMVRLGVSDAAVWNDIAARAVEAMQSKMVAVDGETEIPMSEYLSVTDREGESDVEFSTETITGNGAKVEELTIPYQGRELSGEALREQLEKWTEAGTIEPSCAEALRTVQDNPDWLALPGRAALVLGVGSEMNPMRPLLSWGATVYGVDLPSSPVWAQMRGHVPSTAGTLHVPTAKGNFGADLLTQLPELAAWASGASDDPLTVGTYVYADGGAHVRLSSAADALTEHLLDSGAADGVSYLATPMDTFVVPEDAKAVSNAAYDARQKKKVDVRTLAGTLTRHKLFHRNYDTGPGPGIHDALVPQQGPNYTLAKRLQRWRATKAYADGHKVSLSVSPATNTRSVTKNKALGLVYKGAKHFGIEIFQPETSRALLGALMVHDMYADVPRPEVQWMEESRAAASGGLWRQPYSPRSALTVAAAVGSVKR